MKKHIIITFFQLLSIWAFAQLDKKVVLKKQNYDLIELLSELRNEHCFSIAYGTPPTHRVTFESKTNTLREILQQSLKTIPYKFLQKNGKILIVESKNKQRDKKTISGYVRDKDTGEALVGAAVYLADSRSGTYTNAYGYFNLIATKPSERLVASYVGYDKVQEDVEVSGNANWNPNLSSYNILEEVMVSSKEDYTSIPHMSLVSLTSKDLKTAPMLLGENDVLKALQLLPGVKNGIEGTSAIHVRGGNSDQNLILLDGVPVYNTAHLHGFVSLFNTDAIKKVDFFTGGFPARYGSRLSSVLDVSMKEGNNKEIKGIVNVGLVAAKATVEGPINEKTTFITSYRRTYLDLFLRLFDNSGKLHFSDFTSKINHKLSEKDRLYLSFYSGLDKNESRSRDVFLNSYSDNSNGLQWGSTLSILRWNHIYSPRLFGNSSVYYNRYKMKSFDEHLSNTEIDWSEEYSSSIEDIGLKLDYDFLLNNHINFRFGTSLVHHAINTGISTFEMEGEPTRFLGANPTKGIETASYLENDVSISETIKLNAGVHYSTFHANGADFSSLQPRLSISYKPMRTAFKASYSEMTQYLHLLTNSGTEQPTDLWVPSTENVAPQDAQQVAIGVGRLFGDFEVTIEAYHKRMNNVIRYRGRAEQQYSFFGDSKVVAGNSKSQGVELLTRKSKGRLTGWLGYTLSKTTNQFDELNFGVPFDHRYDRRHDINMTSSYQLKEHITLNGTWVYASGGTVSIPTSSYASTNRLLVYDGSSFHEGSVPIQHYQDLNNYRMRANHRLDVSISWKKQKKRGFRTWTVGAYNVYNRLNPTLVYVRTASGTKPQINETSYFPIIPFASYQFAF